MKRSTKLIVVGPYVSWPASRTGENWLRLRPRAAWFATSSWLACMGAQTKRQLTDWYNKYLEFTVFF